MRKQYILRVKPIKTKNPTEKKYELPINMRKNVHPNLCFNTRNNEIPSITYRGITGTAG